ncbi:MAG: hypothetical protein C7B43_16345 [Sulfobacillus benefaciens]|uniref:Uncharacterized protein n=1 Tax=Sulfobacillus benefaciens TaxID=453960 RepID=A0A2T2WTW2_9FIRM|nr:MAG: hypothetical protein C7B43_16345 [Sulfobacillus benefaciens]
MDSGRGLAKQTKFRERPLPQRITMAVESPTVLPGNSYVLKPIWRQILPSAGTQGLLDRVAKN